MEFYPSLSSALELRERVRSTSEGMKEVETRLEKEVGYRVIQRPVHQSIGMVEDSTVGLAKICPEIFLR